jgi:hypothetical protein
MELFRERIADAPNLRADHSPPTRDIPVNTGNGNAEGMRDYSGGSLNTAQCTNMQRENQHPASLLRVGATARDGVGNVIRSAMHFSGRARTHGVRRA